MAEKKMITVTVKPNSGASAIDFDASSGTYLAFVKESPDKGKANAELLKLIRKKLGARAVIVRGATSRRKLIELF